MNKEKLSEIIFDFRNLMYNIRTQDYLDTTDIDELDNICNRLTGLYTEKEDKSDE